MVVLLFLMIFYSTNSHKFHELAFVLSFEYFVFERMKDDKNSIKYHDIRRKIHEKARDWVIKISCDLVHFITSSLLPTPYSLITQPPS